MAARFVYGPAQAKSYPMAASPPEILGGQLSAEEHRRVLAHGLLDDPAALSHTRDDLERAIAQLRGLLLTLAAIQKPAQPQVVMKIPFWGCGVFPRLGHMRVDPRGPTPGYPHRPCCSRGTYASSSRGNQCIGHGHKPAVECLHPDTDSEGSSEGSAVWRSSRTLVQHSDISGVKTEG